MFFWIQLSCSVHRSRWREQDLFHKKQYDFSRVKYTRWYSQDIKVTKGWAEQDIVSFTDLAIHLTESKVLDCENISNQVNDKEYIYI